MGESVASAEEGEALVSYSLTPENDPTAFKNEQNGKFYHLCDLPMHNHNVPFPYADCNEEYWANNEMTEAILTSIEETPMKKFTTVITGRRPDGSRYNDHHSIQATNQKAAREQIKEVLLDGEKVIYTGPGNKGIEIPPARG